MEEGNVENVERSRAGDWKAGIDRLHFRRREGVERQRDKTSESGGPRARGFPARSERQEKACITIDMVEPVAPLQIDEAGARIHSQSEPRQNVNPEPGIEMQGESIGVPHIGPVRDVGIEYGEADARACERHEPAVANAHRAPASMKRSCSVPNSGRGAKTPSALSTKRVSTFSAENSKESRRESTYAILTP
jgi:hypothetical protein